MVGVAVLVMLASSPAMSEGRGVEFDPIAVRAATRGGFAISGVVELGLGFDRGGAIPKVGLGIAADLGLVFSDRLVLFLRLEGSLLPPGLSDLPPWRGGFVMFGGGPTLDYFLGDRFSIGVGVHATAQFGGVNLVALGLPLRFNFFAPPRGDGAIARKGLVVGAQLGPAINLVGAPLPVLSAMITVGYASW